MSSERNALGQFAPGVRVPMVERFWSHVDKNGPVPEHRPGLGPCWQWTAALRNGYGVIGRGTQAEGLEYAHRLSFIIANGRPPTACVLHHCDNRRCVNPAHLFEGTRLDNVRDMDRKGRRRTRALLGDEHWTRRRPDLVKRGVASKSAKLSDSAIAEILAAHASGARQAALAARYGVGTSTICRIVHGRRRG